MDKFMQNLWDQAQENPVLALGVLAGVMTAASKIIEAHGNHVGSVAYAKDVQRRVKASR